MGSFAGMTAFITGMNRFIAGPVRFMTDLMRQALTREFRRPANLKARHSRDLSAVRDLIHFVQGRRDFPIRVFLDQISRGLTIQLAVTSDEPCSNPPIRQPISENL